MSDPRRERWTLITFSLMILAAVALGFVLWFTRSVMIPFVLAVFIVAVVAPISDFLQRSWHFPRWLSTVCVLAFVFVIAVGVSLLLAYTAQEIALSVRGYAGQARTMLREWTASEANDQQESQQADAAEGIENDWTSWLPLDRERLSEQIEISTTDVEANLIDTVKWALGPSLSIASSVCLMIIFVLFLLTGLDPRRMQQGVYAEIEKKMRRYLSIKTAMSVMTGSLVGIILGLFGLQLATVFGVLTFVLNFVPSIGSIIATFLPLPIAYAQFVLGPMQAGQDPQWGMLLAVIALPGTVQIVIGNVVEPRVMGEGLELHPIVILIALVFWGLLWGPIGAVLAVPITAVIRIATSRFVSLRLVTDTMAGRLPG